MAPKRNVLQARITTPSAGDVYVVAVHAEAHAKGGTKRQHIERFRSALDAMVEAGRTVIGVGDLNTLPPGSDQQFGFPDSVCTNGAVQLVLSMRLLPVRRAA